VQNHSGRIDHSSKAKARTLGYFICNRNVYLCDLVVEAHLGVPSISNLGLKALQHGPCSIDNRIARVNFEQGDETRCLQNLMQSGKQPV
jgi:hypothetical protein